MKTGLQDEILPHASSILRVYPFVGRLALCVSMLAGAAFAADTGLAKTLKAVEDRYNRAATLQLTFTERFTSQGRSRKPESGTLFLRKPGKMRWQYTAPAGKLVVADGKYVYVVTPDSDHIQRMKTKESDDMRAPLAFLLGRLHFEKDFQNFQSRPEGAETWISAEPKSDNLPYTKVEFQVTAGAVIRRVQVTGQDLSVMEFQFDQEKINPPLDAKLFRFEPPPGAIIEEPSN